MIKFVTVWFFVFTGANNENVATIPTMSKQQCEATIKQFPNYHPTRFQYTCVVGQMPVYIKGNQ